MILTSVAAARGQETDSLNHYLEAAAQNNPGLKAGFLAYKAALQKIPQAGAWQDPELEMGIFLKPMDIAGGRQAGEFKLMQMFPWFGVKKAAQAEAAHMARMACEQFRETRDNLYLQVYTEWYTLCSLQQQLINNRANKALLAQLEELAIRRFVSPPASSPAGYALPSPAPPAKDAPGAPASTGGMAGMAGMGGSSAAPGMSPEGKMASMESSGGGMADVLRIQIEMVETDSAIESLLSEIQAAKASFNALLNRPPTSEVEIPESFEQTLFLLHEAGVMNRIERQNPMLGMINEEGLAYKAKAAMDRKMSYPMLGIGLQYMLIKKTDDPMYAMSDMNGKDMFMPMLSVSIPLYRNKYKAQQRENNLWQQASREKYDNTRNALAAELYKAKHLLGDAARKVALYRKQEELANTACNLLVQEFVAGKTDLASVIQLQRQLLGYQLKKAEAIAAYNTRVASIHKLISFEKETEQ
ncbi:MAG: TolC family protein [Tannerellaceae bacterium]|jgi:outer membrane protein TolC|nr:TolC family protein [Tannerellaceae bacterium]